MITSDSKPATIRGMNFSVMQWNVGGFLIDNEINVDYFLSIIKEHSPDVVTFQEAHVNDIRSPALEIAQKLDYVATIDPYCESHLTPGFQFANAIITRLSQEEHEYIQFTNPGYETVHPSWGLIKNHDKGLTVSKIIVKGRSVAVATLHSPPFHLFGYNYSSPEMEKFLDHVAKLLPTTDKLVLTGDFNFDASTISEIYDNFSNQGLDEVKMEQPTTPHGGWGDHIFYKGLSLSAVDIIDDVKTDHFPIIARFISNSFVRASHI